MPRRTRRRGGYEEPQAQPRYVLPEEGQCYEAKTDGEAENFTYLGMYSQDQNRPVGIERQPGGFNWVRGWFTINGQDERKLYIFDTLRKVDCQDGNQDDDGAMEIDDGGRRRRRRRGRKSRRKTLRQRK